MGGLGSFHVEGVQTALFISVLVDKLNQTFVIVGGSAVLGLK